MASKREKWQEIANRGLQDRFDPQTRAKFDEAVNRGLITLPAPELEPAQTPTPQGRPQTAMGSYTQPPMQRIGQFAKDVARIPSAVSETIGREGKETVMTRGLPELAETEIKGVDLGDRAKTFGILSLIGNEEEQVGALKEIGYKIDGPDLKGNYRVTDPSGQESVLNAPGLSTQDIGSLGSQLGLEYVFGRFLKPVGGGLAKRTAAQMGAEAVKSGLQEAAQVGLGGDFNFSDILFNVGTAGAFEVGGDLVGAWWRAANPEAKRLFMQKKSLDALVEGGMTREEIKTLGKRAYLDKKLSSELGVKEPLPVQSMAAGKASYEVPIGEALLVAREDPKYAKILKDRLDKSSEDLYGSMENTFMRLGDTGAVSAVQKVKDQTQAILESPVNKRRAAARFAYKDAFKDVDAVQVGDIDRAFSEAYALAGRDTDIINRLDRARKFLGSEDYKKNLRNWEQAPATDAVGTPLPKGERPVHTVSPYELQEVKQELLDIEAFAKRTNNGKLAIAAKDLADKTRGRLNAVTEGKYSRADQMYGRFSKAIEKLTEETTIGEAAKAKTPRNIKRLLDDVMNPDSFLLEDSQDFLKAIKAVDPAAANDITASYFHKQLIDLKDAAPSEIIEKMFGRTNNVVKMVGVVDKKAAGNLMKIKSLLNKAAVLEGVSPKMAAEAAARQGLDRGVSGLLAEMVGTPGTFLRKSGQSKTIRDNMRTLFEAATNPKWADEFEQIAVLPTTSKEQLERAEGFFNRVKASILDRSAKREATQQALEVMQQRIVDELQAPEQEEQALESARNLPDIKL